LGPGSEALIDSRRFEHAMLEPERRLRALLARELVREGLGLRRVRRRPGGPEVEKAAALALLYWELFREVDWVGGELRARASRGDREGAG